MAEQLILEQTSTSEEQTELAGGKLALMLSGTEDAFVALDGDLGAGKTAFVRGMAKILCPKARVCSPTYTIMRMYEGQDLTLYHFDMYRITSPEDLESVGFYDCRGVIAAEWCANTPYALPDCYYRVNIEKTGETERRITIFSVEQA